MTIANNHEALRLEAEQGNADAQFSLGLMYYKGDAMPKDYVEAQLWFRKAAEQGHAGAQWMIGGMYQHGWGVTADLPEALRWYQKAADQGYALAQKVIEEIKAGI